MQNKSKVLILYASIGLGHKSIAENIGFYLERAGHEVILHDAQKVQGGLLANWGKKIYEKMIQNFPFIWDWFYNSNWFITSTLSYRTKVAARNCDEILRRIRKIQPDVVISTHTTASAIMSYLKTKKLFQGKFGIGFSDFHLHRYWLYDNADFYLANIEEQKQEMIELGVTPEKIFITGMSLKPSPEINVGNVRSKLGINSEEKIVLLASGSQGTDIDEDLISELIARPNVRVIVVCGKNKKLYETLARDFADSRASILSYYNFMDELYAISDIFITKPGGLSTAEALRWHLPMIISHMLPGQEKHNYDYLLKHHLILKEGESITETALNELWTGKFREQLRNNQTLQQLFIGQGGVERALD